MTFEVTISVQVKEISSNLKSFLQNHDQKTVGSQAKIKRTENKDFQKLFKL